MDRLSIIIPVYNCESFIRRCLDSVISQTYTNLEIICVDDGSTDNSGIICNEYMEKDSRIKVFSKANGGESSARNVGLKHVTGKYIGFIDCDDWIEPDMYELLHNIVVDNDVHMGIVNFYKNTDIEQMIMKNICQIPNKILSPKDMMIYALNRDYYMGYCSYIWNKIFSTELVLTNGLSFNENLRFGGDILFHSEAVLSDKCTGVYVNRPFYHYYQRESSTSHSDDISIKQDIMIAYKRIEELLIEKGYSDISFWARGFYCYHASKLAELALHQGKRSIFLFMKKEMLLHFDDYIKTNISFPEKIKKIRMLMQTV